MRLPRFWLKVIKEGFYLDPLLDSEEDALDGRLFCCALKETGCFRSNGNSSVFARFQVLSGGHRIDGPVVAEVIK